MTKKVSLPSVQLQPMFRDKAHSISCAWADPDEGDCLYLTLCCEGMNVTVQLSVAQADEVLKELGEIVAEEKENQK